MGPTDDFYLGGQCGIYAWEWVPDGGLSGWVRGGIGTCAMCPNPAHSTAQAALPPPFLSFLQDAGASSERLAREQAQVIYKAHGGPIPIDNLPCPAGGELTVRRAARLAAHPSAGVSGGAIVERDYEVLWGVKDGGPQHTHHACELATLQPYPAHG